MLKRIAEWLIKLFTGSAYISIDEAAVEISTALKDAAERRNSNQRNFQTMELRLLLNRPVIAIHGGGNTLIGFMTGIDFISQNRDPVPVIKDYISGETLLSFGIVFAYTEARFNALVEMDTNTIHQLFYDKQTTEPYQSNKSSAILSKKMMKDLLTRNGFYEAMKEEIKVT